MKSNNLIYRYRHRMAAFARFLAAVILLFPLLAATAQGDQFDVDYFGPKPPDLLDMVERHHLQVGIDKMNEGRFFYALQDFDFILRRFPNHPKALMLMVEVTNKMGKPGMAEQYFAKALELFPNTAYTHVVYGMHLQKTGKIAGAIDHYKKAIEISPDIPEAHYNLGLVYVAEKRYDLANIEANAAYDLGHPLPGLRRKLEQAGAWKALPKPVVEEKKDEKKVEEKPPVEPAAVNAEPPAATTQPLK